MPESSETSNGNLELDIYIRYNGKCVAICMVRRALSSIGTREKKKLEERRTKKQSREQIKKRGQQKKKENKGEEERGAHRDP